MLEPPPADDRTFACRLSPSGEGGVGLIELQGPRSAEILQRLFVNPRGRRADAMTPGRLLYGKLFRQGEFLDEVLLERAPDEEAPAYVINCHGGAVAGRRVVDALIAEGAVCLTWAERLAIRCRQGALDALQARAAELLPGALTLRAAAMLLDQYHGALSVALRQIIATLRQGGDSAAPMQCLRDLLRTAPFGRALIDPPTLALAGRPNVGKSTLGNALLRFERMIVHPRPGTTRDTIEETLAIRDLPFRLVDTAGLRAAEDAVEADGVERSLAALRLADIALLVFDASVPLQPEDRRALQAAAGRVLPVLNKSDLPRVLDSAEIRRLTGLDPVPVCALTGAGLPALEKALVALAYPHIPPRGAPVLFTAAQETALRQALELLERRDAAGAIRMLEASLKT